MQGISFRFGGTSHVGFHHQTLRITAKHAGGCIKKRFAGNNFFRGFHIRNDQFFGLTGTSGQSGEGGTAPHQFHKTAAVHPAFLLGFLTGGRRLGQMGRIPIEVAGVHAPIALFPVLFQHLTHTAQVQHAVLISKRSGGMHIHYRWQIEQLVKR
jgi:hypothetical protein